MNAASDSSLEAKRLEALRRYRILDTETEASFDDLAGLAAIVTGMPIAVISFTDENRTWFKSRLGSDVLEIPSQGSFAALVAASKSFLEVPDAKQDERFKDNLLVSGEAGIRFYAGAPLLTPEGLAIGSLAVMDRVPGKLNEQQRHALQILARQVMDQLELRQTARELSREADRNMKSAEALEQAESRFKSIFENVNEGIFQTTPEGHYLAANPMLARIYGYASPNDLQSEVRNISDQLYVKPGRREEFARLLKAQDGITNFESEIRRKDGSVIWISENARAIRDDTGNVVRYEGTVEDITTRKRAEETLLKSEQHFHAIWDTCADGMRLTDESGNILAVNQAFCDMVGMPESEMVGKHFTSVYDAGPEAQRIVEQYKERFAARTVRKRQEQTVVFRSGRRIDIALSNSFIESPGKPPVLLSTFHDVTERRRAEEMLRQSEVLYHSLVENLPQNIFRKDREGRITFCNRRYSEELKRPASELVGLTDFDLFPDDLAAKYRKDDRRVMELGETLDTIEEHQTPDGKLYVHVIKTPLRDANGAVLGVQGMFWDVTQERVTELALARERELMRSLLESLPDRIYFKDSNSRFLKISRALADEFKLNDPEDAVGKTDFDFFSEAHAKPAYEDEQRIMLTGSPLIGKTEKETWQDGSITWALTTKMPLKDHDGRIIGTFGVSRDITKLKTVEEDLAKARDEALASAKMKAEFLAIMSHEIRTPMNGVLGMTGLLLDTPLTQEQLDFARTIRSSAEALLDIINDILDFSKIEAGKIDLERIDFDFREEMENAVELMAERAQTKGLELALDPGDFTPYLRGDPGRLRQVLLNLLGNAVKFTEHGEVVVRAIPTEETSNSVRLRINISDTGIGIPESARSKIFESFTQADTSTTRRYGGTGLGLAICKQLVELMGGRIGVDSEPGQGTTFWIELPFEKQASPQPRTGFDSLEGARVLIVDDNETNRRILEHQTASWRMRPFAVESAKAALRELAKAADIGQPFDLAILDMHMPEMDGLELARVMHSDPGFKSVHRVMLTSLNNRLDSEILAGAGITAQLLKPAKQSRLYNALVQALGRDGSSQSRLQGSFIAGLEGKWQGKPLRILIAEDHPANQKIALLQLRKLGLNADLVSNGEEVLSSIAKVPYDVVLMDCHMPLLDGYETTRRIREGERARNAPRRTYIVALTANVLDGERLACLNAGMDDYVTKPTRVEDLKAALGRAASTLAESAPSVPVLGETSIGTLLDSVVLDGLRELRVPDEPDPLQELISLFLEDAPPRIEAIREAIAAKDSAKLINASHTLKGSANNLGAIELGNICSAIESSAKASEFDPCRDALASLESVFERTRKALLAECSE